MEIKTLPFELRGNQNAKSMVIFLHGWPDTCRLWDFYVNELEEKYIILNITYHV
jgi:pimeloyl-ACP methyl ester carboxylesterase